MRTSALFQLKIRIGGSGRGYESGTISKAKRTRNLVHYPKIKLEQSARCVDGVPFEWLVEFTTQPALHIECPGSLRLERHFFNPFASLIFQDVQRQAFADPTSEDLSAKR